jgi:O-antigen ligase
MQTAVLAAVILAFSFFAFGAVYPWASRSAAAASVVLVLVARPRLFGERTWIVDVALAALLGWSWAGLVPLPPAVVNLLTPGSASFHQTMALRPFDASAWRPLSLVPAAGLDAAIILTAACFCYWSVREATGHRGARALIQGVALIGAAGTLLAVLHPVLFPGGLIYGVWRPYAAVAQPIGPIISRNHFAAFMLTAVPLIGGYLGWRARARWAGHSLRQSSVRALTDAQALLMFAALAITVAGVMLSQSRAGAIGLAAASLLALTGGWREFGARGRAGLAVLVVGLLLAAFFVASPANVMTRLSGTADDQWGGRPMIWRATLELVRRYPVTGVGYGAYEGAMPVYQPEPRGFLINHAHNQYLEVLAEGGVIGVGIAGVLLVGLVGLYRRRLRHDPGPHTYVRQGAMVGLSGLAVQCVWETPFLTPTVLLLAACAAGIATARHARSDGPGGASSRPEPDR